MVTCSVQPWSYECMREVAKHEKRGQHSLTSVKRPFFLRPRFRKRMMSLSPRSLICDAFVLVWCLVKGLIPLVRSLLDWFLSIQTRRCHCLRLKDVLMFQASSYSAGKKTFQWMLLNNILRKAPAHRGW